MKSIWTQIQKKDYSRLKQDIDTDIAIIGGGLSGILTAYLLKQKGLQATIFEAATIGSGQTGKTTAKITAQHGPIYAQLIENFGFQTAKLYAKAQLEALQQYRQLIDEKGIDCDFQTVDTFLYTNENKALLEKEYFAYQELGLDGYLTDQTELPIPIIQALALKNQAIFHPLKFLYTLANQLDIYEHTPISDVKEHTLITKDGLEINAGKIVFACHFPFVNIPGYFFLKLYQSRSYLSVYPNKQPVKNAYLSIDQPAMTWRSYHGQLIFGGMDHPVGKTPEKDPFQAIKSFQSAPYSYAWAAQDCMSLDGLPYCGYYSPKTPDWFVLTGYQKWGMTNAMASAKLIVDLILSKRSPYAAIVDPARFDPGLTLRPFLKQTKTTMQNYLSHLMLPPYTAKSLPIGQGAPIWHHFQKKGAYKDEQGNLHLISLCCPHLGCELKWNAAEKTWDCPCHGSRFDIDGHLIDNPAKKPLKNPKR